MKKKIIFTHWRLFWSTRMCQRMQKKEGIINFIIGKTGTKIQFYWDDEMVNCHKKNHHKPNKNDTVKY